MDRPKIADEVRKVTPDVVLMDEGISNDFSGADVVRELKKSEKWPFIIGNSGGMAEELIAAGARGNFKKGEDLKVLRQVAARVR